MMNGVIRHVVRIAASMIPKSGNRFSDKIMLKLAMR